MSILLKIFVRTSPLPTSRNEGQLLIVVSTLLSYQELKRRNRAIPLWSLIEENQKRLINWHRCLRHRGCLVPQATSSILGQGEWPSATAHCSNSHSVWSSMTVFFLSSSDQRGNSHLTRIDQLEAGKKKDKQMAMW